MRANVPITTTPLPEETRPFPDGSLAQVAEDLARVQQIAGEKVFFANQTAQTIEEALETMAVLQAAAH